MPKQLERAKIIQVKPAGSSVEVLFNPSEYRVSKSNQFSEVAVPGLSAPILQYSRGNSQTLTMKLFFDTYDPRHAEGRYGKDQDVTLYTRRVTDLMKINSELHRAPYLPVQLGQL